MNGLVSENGMFRSSGAGVFDGEALIHMASPAEFVPEHIHNLFAWYQQADNAGFVELMLEIIRDSLKEVTVVGRSTDQDKTPVNCLFSALGDNTLSATELMKRLGLSHNPTFRKN